MSLLMAVPIQVVPELHNCKQLSPASGAAATGAREPGKPSLDFMKACVGFSLEAVAGQTSELS